MTYIEFFDKPSIENICSCLAKIPDRVIFIGNNSRQMKKRMENYTRVFSDRGESIEFISRSISYNHLDGAVALLSEIVETYDDCMFDVTGMADGQHKVIIETFAELKKGAPIEFSKMSENLFNWGKTVINSQ